MILSKLTFYAGPLDGMVIRDDPSFLEHYYIPIEGQKYHYYQRNGFVYVYQGVVEVVPA